jgi:DNA-binding PadR family transcriptional regulator
MIRTRKPSRQTLAILAALAEARDDWLYGLELAARTGLKSGSLYPILIRLDERALLESRWIEPSAPGRPPRHGYRILPAGLRALAESERPVRARARTRERLA